MLFRLSILYIELCGHPQKCYTSKIHHAWTSFYGFIVNSVSHACKTICFIICPAALFIHKALLVTAMEYMYFIREMPWKQRFTDMSNSHFHNSFGWNHSVYLCARPSHPTGVPPHDSAPSNGFVIGVYSPASSPVPRYAPAILVGQLIAGGERITDPNRLLFPGCVTDRHLLCRLFCGNRFL
jgi:hypothetical protein